MRCRFRLMRELSSTGDRLTRRTRVAGRPTIRGLAREGGREGAAGSSTGCFGGIPACADTGSGGFFVVGQVAQLVEHTAENRGVAGSIPALAMGSGSVPDSGRRNVGP